MKLVSDALHRNGSNVLQGWQILHLSATVIAVAFYVLIVAPEISWPPVLLSAASYGLSAFVLPAGFFLYQAYRRSDWIGEIVGLSLTLVLFALPLIALWYHVGRHNNAVGGLLPRSDALGYYKDALRLLDGHLLGWSGRRPLFTGYLATLLAMTGRNLQAVLAIFAAVTAIACHILAREVKVTHGPAAAVASLLVLFLYYRSVGGSGVVLTENLGLPLGIIAFSFLWRAGAQHRDDLYFLGIGLLSLALNARAGAFFVLPALLLAGIWTHGRSRGRLKFAAISFLMMATGFVANLLLVKTLAESSIAFSNFSQVLYGLVTGGTGWGQVHIDYPNATEGSEIYKLALQAFLSDPMGLVTGSLKAWGDYLPNNPYHAFSFIRGSADSKTIQTLCYGLTAFGAVICAMRYRERHLILLLAAAFGHMISIPFVPPNDGGLRVYAATIAIMPLLVAVGVAELSAMPGRLFNRWSPPTRLLYFFKRLRTSKAHPVPLGLSIALGVFLPSLAIAGPFIVYALATNDTNLDQIIQKDQAGIYVRINPGSYLTIAEDMPSLEALRNRPDVLTSHVPGTAQYPTTIRVDNPARFVRVQLAGSNHLSLAEVEVVPPGNNSVRRNLALGKPTRQVDVYSNGTADRAVDGNPDGAWSSGSVTCTSSIQHAWWEVDLGSIRDIGEIRLWNRTARSDRLTDFFVLVSTEPFADYDPKRIPLIRRADLLKTVDHAKFGRGIDWLEAGMNFTVTYDLRTGRIIWLMSPTGHTPGILKITGNLADEDIARSSELFYAENVQAIVEQ